MLIEARVQETTPRLTVSKWSRQSLPPPLCFGFLVLIAMDLPKAASTPKDHERSEQDLETERHLEGRLLASVAAAEGTWVATTIESRAGVSSWILVECVGVKDVLLRPGGGDIVVLGGKSESHQEQPHKFQLTPHRMFAPPVPQHCSALLRLNWRVQNQARQDKDRGGYGLAIPRHKRCQRLGSQLCREVGSQECCSWR